MATPLVRAAGITVERSGHVLVDDVDLSIDADDRTLIQGPSGAGKTTLFQVLGLLEVPTGGRLLVDGTDAAALSADERAALRRDLVGVVFQDFQLVPDLTARENAALPQEHAGDRDDRYLDGLFDRLHIADLADQYPATLSGGEKQRVAIVRALANRPSIVLADEPTGELDPETADSVLELLFDLQADTGVALVIVSHDPAVGERFDRDAVVRIEDGRVVESSPP